MNALSVVTELSERIL
nr:unnamed protein product [Callosobruchus chinensis]